MVGPRAKAPSDDFGIGGVSVKRLHANFGDYVKVNDMMIPSTCWKPDGIKEKIHNLYFKGENFDFSYTFE